MSRKYAVAVGVDNYYNIKPLQYAERDAKSFRDFCLKKAGFDQVYLLAKKAPPLDAPKGPPLRSKPTIGNLRRFLHVRFLEPFLSEEDTLWFFFAGHGKRFDRKDYLLAVDSSPHDVEMTGLHIRDIADRLRNSGAGTIVMMIDACRGYDTRDDIEGLGLEKYQGIITLFSCSPSELSYEIPSLQQGSFTYALLEWLSAHKKEKCATFQQLYSFLREQVPQINKKHKKGRQTPYASVEPYEKMRTCVFSGRDQIQERINELSKKLNEAEKSSNWHTAENYCIEIIKLSPKNIIAIEAMRRITINRIAHSSIPDLNQYEVKSLKKIILSKGLKELSAYGKKDIFVDRELSWIEFNYRVLHEAMDERNPLLERLNFLSIFSSNLDEFFMVRVARLKTFILANVRKRTRSGLTPTAQLQSIRARLKPIVDTQHQHFERVLRQKMRILGIELLNFHELNNKQKQYVTRHFREQIFPVLTPIAIDSGHPFPYVSNLSLNLAIEVLEENSDEVHFARVKVPKVLPRFINIPTNLSEHGSEEHKLNWTGVSMEQVIADNISALFPGLLVKDCYTFRITRNVDLLIEEDEADDLMLAIEDELRKRRLGGRVVRLEVESRMSQVMRSTLISELNLTDIDVYDVEGHIGLADFQYFLGLSLSRLKYPHWSPVIPTPWKDVSQAQSRDIFALIREKDRLVHHPYDSFDGTVQAFIAQAASDPGVLAIKMTLYRTTRDSLIVDSLIRAAEDGKQIVALVELKARFDEENNINWARTLERSGVHVVYGLMGLKTHTKTALVVRREGNSIRKYVHVGTGNYNSKTACLYTDLGLFSCRHELGEDLTDLFNYLTGYSCQSEYKSLLVAPASLRSRLLELMNKEIEIARKGGVARIIAKVNSLEDTEVIKKLCEASQAGVKIDLIVRGICCLRPGILGVSDNIRIVSIIGRFLEHTRVYYFHNNGDKQVFMGSADWMSRNLSYRIEAVVLIKDSAVKKELIELLNTCMNDNRQAWDMHVNGSYMQRHPQNNEVALSTQAILMQKALSSS